MLDNKIRVTSIQRLCVNDGPGVRTVVFLKGCYLNCPWCCNPESIHYDEDSLFNRGGCIKDNNKHICNKCIIKGGAQDVTQCPLGVFEKTYNDYNVEELYSLISKDLSIYNTGGGVTFSGGEPLFQAKQITPLLKILKDNNINIAFETTLYAPINNYILVKEFVDYWLVDLKFQFGYIPNPDYNINRFDFESNLSDLQNSFLSNDIQYRMVIMQEIIDNIPNIVEKLNIYKIDNIELLAYHNLSNNKYKQLNKNIHSFTSPDNIIIDQFKSFLHKHNIRESLLKI